MRMFRRMPKSKLRSTMTVCVPRPDGTFAEPVAIIGVLFIRKDEVVSDAHRSYASKGVVYVDSVNSKGAFEVPVGSRVAIDGHSYIVQACEPNGDLFTRIHNWKLRVG